MFSPRNKIEIVTLPISAVEAVDTLFEVCDAEFSSRNDVHNSFQSARGAASWARYYLLHEVRKVAARDGIFCSYHMAFVVASKLSEVWFEQKEIA